LLLAKPNFGKQGCRKVESNKNRRENRKNYVYNYPIWWG